MTITYEAALNEVTRLEEQQQSWTEKRAQLVRTIADVKANAGASALAGTSTSKMADQVKEPARSFHRS